MTSCCVPMCNNSGGYRFPLDEQRRRQWIKAIRGVQNVKIRDGWAPAKYDVVCSKHFVKSDYMQNTVYGIDRSRKRLLHSAVPSVFGCSEVKLEPGLDISMNAADGFADHWLPVRRGMVIKLEEGIHEDGETQDESFANSAVGESGSDEITPPEQEINHADVLGEEDSTPTHQSHSEPSTAVSTLEFAAGDAVGRKKKVESRSALRTEVLMGLKEDFKERKKVWDEELKMLEEERKKRVEEVKMKMEVHELKLEYYKLKIKKVKDSMK